MNTSTKLGEIIRTVDTFLSNLAMYCNITLMPGEYDPTNAMLPQKPFHPCLLPKSSRFIYIYIYILNLMYKIFIIYSVYSFYFYIYIDLKILKVLQIHGLVKLKDE